MRILVTLIILLLSAGTVQATTPNQFVNLRADRTVPCTANIITNPAYLASVVDPCFGTTMINIGPSPGQVAHGAAVTKMIPVYSRADAWNSDGTKMMNQGSGGYGHIRDGNTYAYIKSPTIGVNDTTRWSQTNPDLFYTFTGLSNKIQSYNVVTDVVTTVVTFAGYTHCTTGSEGNFSLDGRYIPVMGQNSSFATQDVFVYDMQTDTIGTKFNIPAATTHSINFVDISASGAYVFIGWNPVNGVDDDTARYTGLEMYDRDMNFIRQVARGISHGDNGVDADGSDIYVTTANPHEWATTRTYTSLFKYQLAAGTYVQVIDDLVYGAFAGHHVSLRNTSLGGWVLVSAYDLSFAGADITSITGTWWALEQEVYALKLDGTKEIRRIAHHRSFWLYHNPGSLVFQSDYYSEPHATTNRTFTKVFFGSNWKQMPVEEILIAPIKWGYVIDLTTVLPIAPAAMRAMRSTATDCTLSWAVSTATNVTAYKLYRRTSGGSYGAAFKRITPAQARAVHSPQGIWTDRQAVAGTYYYHVTNDSDDGESDPSNEVSCVLTGFSATAGGSILASDSFDTDGATLGANWSNNSISTTFQRVTGLATVNGSTDAAARYSGITWPNDQRCSVIHNKVLTSGGLGAGYGCTVRTSTSGTTVTYYRFVCSTAGWELGKKIADAFTSLATSTTACANGDVTDLQAVGTTLTAYINNVLVTTKTDSSIASGAAGIAYSSTGGDTTFGITYFSGSTPGSPRRARQ